MDGRHELLAFAAQIVSAHVETQYVIAGSASKANTGCLCCTFYRRSCRIRTTGTSASGAGEKFCLTEPGSLSRLR